MKNPAVAAQDVPGTRVARRLEVESWVWRSVRFLAEPDAFSVGVVQGRRVKELMFSQDLTSGSGKHIMTHKDIFLTVFVAVGMFSTLSRDLNFLDLLQIRQSYPAALLNLKNVGCEPAQSSVLKLLSTA